VIMFSCNLHTEQYVDICLQVTVCRTGTETDTGARLRKINIVIKRNQKVLLLVSCSKTVWKWQSLVGLSKKEYCKVC